MLEFSRRLVSKGIKATLATTAYIKKSKYAADPSTASSHITVETISDGFDEGGHKQAEGTQIYLSTLEAVGSISLAELIKKSCTVNNIYYHVHQGLLLLPVTGPTVSLPRFPLLQASDTPSFVSDFGSYPAWYHTVVVDWMTKRWRLRTIGPIVPSMYLDKRVEASTYMAWLQDKPNGSVVFVSFGSAAELGVEQMEEVAWGLKQSDCYFLWAVRASEEAKLPKNIVEETSEKGLVVSWCPQLDVLAHESIGCFIIQCGFNSVMEALSLGVPMVAMPQWTDQPTNAKYVEDVWRTGIRTGANEKGIVRRDNIELCVREVIMEGEKGKEIKESAVKWKNLARE
ncbi:hypothetical protein Tsubulata_008741, partial [Turnera subulata]